MTRYIRLGYLIPRLVLLIVLFVLAEYGAGWGMRYAIVDGGQQATGAKVELEQATVSLLDTRATLRGLSVADPQRPMQNLLEADLIELDFETDSLLRRKGVVQHGTVRGLRFSTERETSGQLEATEESAAETPAWLGDAAKGVADAWVNDLESKLTTDLADQFQSVRLAEEMAERWPARYEALRVSASTLRDDIEQLKADAIEAKSNPLRNAGFLTKLPTRIATLKQRLTDLHREFAAAPAEVAVDRQRIREAQAHDEQLVRSRFQADQLDPESLTTYLLGDQVTAPLNELIGWVRWTRSMVPAATASQKRATPAARGSDVHFLGLRPRPDLLIRTLELQGEATVAGRPVELAGIVTDLTTQPDLHGAPTRVVLKTNGPLPMEVRAIINRAGAEAVDELFVDCPKLVLPGYDLGKSDKIRIEMAPSSANLSISLRVEGDRLSGEVQLIQEKVRLTPTLADDVAPIAKRFGHALAAGLERMPKAATRVTLSGTLDHPEMAIWSTLGPAVAESFQRSFQLVAQEETERLLAGSRGQVDRQLARLNKQLSAATAVLTAELQAPSDALQQLAGGALGPPGSRGTLSFEKLGKQLPGAGAFFR